MSDANQDPFSEFKYDVAFSFLGRDERIALELNDRLQKRLKTFVFSRQQEKLAGRDGAVVLTKVFGTEARMVVVLYRTGWGETPFTRIEQEAIRDRAHDQGFDFVTFVVLEEKPALPKWLPRSRLWYLLPTYGLEGAAAAIETRFIELGGQASEESVVDRAARYERERQRQARRDEFLRSEPGVDAARAEFAQLRASIDESASAIRGKVPALDLKLTGEHPDVIEIMRYDVSLHAVLSIKWRNNLDGAYLLVNFWRGVPPYREHLPEDAGKSFGKMRFTFDLLSRDINGWIDALDRREFATKELAEHVMKAYLGAIDRQRSEEPR